MRNNFVRKACGIACESMGTPTWGGSRIIPRSILDFSAPVQQQFPATAAGLATLLGDAAAVADSIYLCDDTSGAMVDALGVANLSAVGAPLYAQPANGLCNGTDLTSMVALEASNASAKFAAADNTVHESATGSFAHVVYFRVENTSDNHYLLRKRATNGFYVRLHTSGQLWFFCSGTSATPLSSVAGPYHDGAWHMAIIGYHDGDNKMHLRTEHEYATNTNDLGDLTNSHEFTVLDSAPGSQLKYVATFSGAAAEALLDLGATAISNFWKHATNPATETMTTQTRAGSITIPVGVGATATFAEDTLPIGYAAGFTGSKYGLFCNKATENLCEDSELLSNWTQSGTSTTVDNFANSAEGFRAASKVTAGASADFVKSMHTTVASTQYTTSILIKESTVAVSGRLVMYDESNGAELGAAAFTADAGWDNIISVTASTILGGISTSTRLEITTSGESVLAGGAQMETGPARTSHKKTTGAAASLGVSTYTANFDTLAAQGEILSKHISVDNDTGRVYDCLGTANQNRKYLRNMSASGNRARTYDGAGSTEFETTNAFITAVDQELIARQIWDQSAAGDITGGLEGATVRNGATIEASASPWEGSTGAGAETSKVEIGHTAGSNQLSGVIQSIASYDVLTEPIP